MTFFFSPFACRQLICWLHLCVWLHLNHISMGKKDDGKPRGRMSSYAFFVQTCREEHKKKHPGESVVFAEFTKKCAEKWKVNMNWKQIISYYISIHVCLSSICLHTVGATKDGWSKLCCMGSIIAEAVCPLRGTFCQRCRAAGHNRCVQMVNAGLTLNGVNLQIVQNTILHCV